MGFIHEEDLDELLALGNVNDWLLIVDKCSALIANELAQRQRQRLFDAAGLASDIGLRERDPGGGPLRDRGIPVRGDDAG